MALTRAYISEATGFDNGDLFQNEEQVRQYFTPDNIAAMFGECALSAEELHEMAETVIDNGWHMTPITWQVIEDSGGGLHLAVFDGDTVIFCGSGYEHNEDGLRADLEALRNGGDPRTDAWEMPADDPQAAYDRLTGHETGWTVVADQDGVYWERMGAAATQVFAVHWSDLVLLDEDGDTELNVSNEDKRSYLDEFRRTGGISGVFFARLGLPHEDEDDASTWGPLSPDHVDWTGF